FQKLMENNGNEVHISKELHVFFDNIQSALEANLALLNDTISDQHRRDIMDGLGGAGSKFRNQIYEEGFSGEKSSLSVSEFNNFTKIVLSYLDHSIDANRRADGMYHAYNLMTVEGHGGVSISYLEEMLEGQVAALSSGYIDSSDALVLLNSMKSSKLFREDQFSYLLYPNKELPGFSSRNVIPKDLVQSSSLLKEMVDSWNNKVINKDIHGQYHFNGNFKNASDLKDALEGLKEEMDPAKVDDESQKILQIFEQVFNHKAFTGRSGTFYGYEGLGSIYWHMVSKLLLAVEECCLRAVQENQSDGLIGQLLEHFYEINEGIGVHKSPKLYGAFPIDPYSHTPLNKGAQQPGMTGQVKEDILSRMGEIGVFVKDGQLQFNPCLLRQKEFLTESKVFNYIDIHQQKQSIELSDATLAFTFCQVPMIYSIENVNQMEVRFADGESKVIDSLSLDKESSKEVFNRTGSVESIKISIKQEILK
ncbi:MAG: hypothetical protein AAF391_11900, partial [Bacteroidota bacterium]